MKEVAATHIDTAKKLFDFLIEFIAKYSLQVLGGIIVLILGWIVSKLVARFIKKLLDLRKVDVTITKFLVGAVKLSIMAFAVLVALGKFGIEIAPFIAGLSVVGFGTSFALQGPLSNYAAGASLIFTKPFKVGDIIEVIKEMGEVVDISLPQTVLKTVDGTVIVIPNKHIIGEIIHNYTDLKKLDIRVGVSYQSNIDKAIDCVRSIIMKDHRTVQHKETKVGIFDLGDSSINIYARVWCKQADYWDVMFSINKCILEEFKKHGIEIPFPQRDVRIHSQKI